MIKIINIILLVNTVYSLDSLGTDISNEIGVAKALCDGSFGDSFDSLGNTLNTVITSIDNTIKANEATCIAITASVDNEVVDIISSSNDLVPLKQEVLSVSNRIKDLIEDITDLINDGLAFAEIMDKIELDITGFEGDVNANYNEIKNNIINGVSDLTTNTNNKFNTFSTYINYVNGVPFPSIDQLISNKIDQQTSTTTSSLTTIKTDVNTKFGDINDEFNVRFKAFTTYYDSKFTQATSDLIDSFTKSTGNIDKESISTGNDIKTKFDALKQDIEDLQTNINNFIVQEKQTVNSARNNVKWFLGLQIDYGSDAKAEELSQIHVFDDNFNDGLLIKVKERDLYIIGALMVIIKFIWIGMVVYLIVKRYNITTPK